MADGEDKWSGIKKIALDMVNMVCVAVAVVFALSVLVLGLTWLFILLFGHGLIATVVTILMLSSILAAALQAVTPEFHYQTDGKFKSKGEADD